jgi:hypothetical protein
MAARNATRTAEPRLLWFVRAAAVLVALANLVGVVVWFIGGLYVLGGESESSLREALPSAIAAVLAGLTTSQIVLRAFELPGRGFWHRYGVVVAAVCIGGAIEGAMLGFVFSMDGTLFPEPPAGFYAEHPIFLLSDLAYSLLGAGSVGGAIGLAFGVAEGLILGLPLGAVLGALRDDRPSGRPRHSPG